MGKRSHQMFTAGATGAVSAQSINKPAVLVSRSRGESLFYRVTVPAGVAAWVFSCAHREEIRTSLTEPGHPKSVYEWTMAGGDFDAADDVYSVTMVFGPALRYDVRTELRDISGNTLDVLTDLVFQGGNDGDFAREELRVFVL